MDTAIWVLRGSAFALIALQSYLFWRDARTNALGQTGTMLNMGLAAYIICSTPLFHHGFHLLKFPVLVLCIAVPFLFWLFARALFDDAFQIQRHHWVILAIIESLHFIFMFVHPEIPSPFRSTISIILRLIGAACVILALAQVWADSDDDLDPIRRRFRGLFVVVVGLYMLGVLVSEVTFGPTAGPMLVVVHLTAINTFALYFMSRMVGLSNRHLPFELPIEQDQNSSDAPKATAPDYEFDPKLQEKLNQAMVHERLYRQDGLTIAELASKIGSKEYLLRRLINQSLGYRNFSAFLNHYRLAEAKHALADPSQTDVPILTIALDAGYASLGPFNRAFKLDTGLTPSDYRRQASASQTK